MNNFVLNIRKIKDTYTKQNLAEILNKRKDNITLVFPGDFIGNSQSSADIANDYLEILYAGEKLAGVCESIKERFVNGSVHFIFKPINKNDLVDVLFEILDVIEWADEDSELEFIDYKDEFIENLEQKTVQFPEIADAFLANFVNSISSFEDKDYIENLYDRFPEWKYGFWHSFASNELNYDVYVSTYAWIVPHSAKGKETEGILKKVLQKFAGFEDRIPLFHEVQWISASGLPPIAFHQYVMTSYPYEAIEVARECVAEIRKKEFFERPPSSCSKKEKAILEIIESPENHKEAVSSKLSEEGEVLVARDALAYYIFFKEKHELAKIFDGGNPSYDDILFSTFINTGGAGLYELPEKIRQKFINLIDVAATYDSFNEEPINLELPWDKLDADKFEQLCYDIIGKSEVFDPETLRLMGKTKSRDGGRDIEVYSRKHLGIDPVKWIVQCKFTKNKDSLSGSRINVTDTITKYGARGLIIMTNARIDSTLHDKLEDISRNLGIEFDEWDVMRMQKVIAKPSYQNIRKRYFDS